MTTSRPTRRPRAWRAVGAALMAVGLVAVAVAPAQAVITRSDFPRTPIVKASMKGTGTWQRWLGDEGPVGAAPARCRSDLPFSAAREYRSSWYAGRVAGTRKYTGQSAVGVYRFSSPQAAAQAMADVARFVTDCPTSTEWVCERCDGVWDITRRPAAPRRVGQESVAWTEKRRGMGAERVRVIAARTEDTVVVTSSSHVTDPMHLRYPPAPTWKRTASLARAATRAAQ